jgi:hypothetical protein
MTRELRYLLKSGTSVREMILSGINRPDFNTFIPFLTKKLCCLAPWQNKVTPLVTGLFNNKKLAEKPAELAPPVIWVNFLFNHKV